MKFTFSFLALFLLHTVVYGQIISLSEKNASLEKVFRSIEKQCDYIFWYEYPVVRKAGKLTINIEDESLETALTLCLEGKPLTYALVGKTIVITQKESHQEMLEVSGRVTDTSGTPLEGASVMVKGMQSGAKTDINGNFKLSLPTGAVLHVSLVGYESQIRMIESPDPLNIRLNIAVTEMDDVVVIGYGSLARQHISGAIASISDSAIARQPVTSLDQAIAAQAAGVQVSQVTGTPGGGLTIRVRGINSISAGNEPLYVIDGFPVEGRYNRDLNPLATIDPGDIASMQVLKDASAVAIYGSRGSNGVVLITTRRGKAGGAVVKFDSYYGLQQVARKIDMLNAAEYAIYNTEARNNAWEDMGGSAEDPDFLRPEKFRIPPLFSETAFQGKGTDWQDEIFRTAPIQHHRISLTNGTDSTSVSAVCCVF